VNTVLSRLLDIAILVFSVSSMLSLGLSYTAREIIAPLRNVGEVVRVLIANFVLVPLLAYLVVRLLALDQSFENGLMLIAMAAGAPFLIKLTAAASGDLAVSATLLALLLPVTVVYLPLVLPLVLPGVNVDAGDIALPLFLSLLLPLGVGLFVKARWSRWPERLQPVLGKLSTVALVVLIGTTFLVNFHAIVSVLGEGAILAALIVTAGAFAIGYLMGWSTPEKQDEIALGTAQRNIAAATVVTTQSFDDPDTLVMVIISSLAGWIVLFPIAGVLRRREARKAEAMATKLKQP
jgi:predicted Na+-dependent transporter